MGAYRYFGLRGRRLAVARVILIVLPSFLLFGYNQSSLGGVLAFTSFTHTFPRIDTTNTTGAKKAENARIQGTVVAIYTLGCLVGALSISYFGNRFGRRRTLVGATTVATIGIVLQASSFGLPQMIIGRIISGVGVGAVNAIVPVWQSECTKPKNRGKYVVVLGIFIATGIAAASWVNFGLSYHQTSSVCWRLPLALPVIFAFLIASFTFCFPESPRWLLQKGRVEQAKKVMSILENIPEDSEIIRVEIESIQRIWEEENSREIGWRQVFTMGPQRLFYRAALAFIINYNAQMTGANLISYYATTIFHVSLKLPSHRSSLLAAGVLTWKVLAAFLAFLTVDRFGRKPLFMVSGVGMGISMMGLAISVSKIDSHNAGNAATFFLFLFMFFFPLGFLGANFLYATEIAPQELRVHMSAIGTATHWLFNFVIAEITPIAFNNIGYKYYIVYAVTGAMVCPIVYFLFPETNGRSLEDMGKIFARPEHWWQVPAEARRLPRGELADMEDMEGEDLTKESAVHIPQQVF